MIVRVRHRACRAHPVPSRHGSGFGWRRSLAFVAMLALVLKIMVPAGFMPGTSLAAPIILCPDAGTMPAMTMAHGGHQAPSKAPHDGAAHPCAFAAAGMAAFVAAADGSGVLPIAAGTGVLAAAFRVRAPGRGLAAPPPPSHAPPISRT